MDILCECETHTEARLEPQPILQPAGASWLPLALLSLTWRDLEGTVDHGLRARLNIDLLLHDDGLGQAILQPIESSRRPRRCFHHPRRCRGETRGLDRRDLLAFRFTLASLRRVTQETFGQKLFGPSRELHRQRVSRRHLVCQHLFRRAGRTGLLCRVNSQS